MIKTSCLLKARMVDTPVRAESKHSKSGDLVMLSRRLHSRAAA